VNVMPLPKMPPKQLKELEATLLEMKKRAQEDPVFFFDQFLYTFDPRVSPFHLRFKTFDFQRRLIREILDAIENQHDIYIEKSRDMGATYTVLGVFLWLWLWRPGVVFWIGSRKEDYVDNRRGGVVGNKEESLFGKIDYMLSRLPSFLLPEGFDRNKFFTYMSLTNPETGNSIGGESSNDNFSRGARKTAVLFDEFAFWETGTNAWGSAGSSTFCRIILTTPGNKPSKAKRLRFGKDGEKIKIVSLLYNLDPRKDAKWLEAERKRHSTENFNREVMLNWELSATGRVYPEIENAAYGEFPLLLNSPSYFSWDFGWDGISVGFWQKNPANARWRLVDSYHNEGKVIQYYTPLFNMPMDSKFNYTDDDLKAIEAFRKYPKGIHFGDPDVEKTSIQTGISTRQELEKSNIFVQSTGKNDFFTRREMTKVALQTGIEVNVGSRNDYFLEGVKSSRYPARSEESDATTPIIKPVHNWTSHPRTMMEYFFVNVDAFTTESAPPPSWANQARSWLTSRKSITQRRSS